uniref:Uncharacterized protein n=1 Tax=Tanacetum cinerariifolium TaxID=118510 RepID=A0A699I5R4_TANCI|nr:hypothetical protein [Tanacetum cinerariifolium]
MFGCPEPNAPITTKTKLKKEEDEGGFRWWQWFGVEPAAVGQRRWCWLCSGGAGGGEAAKWSRWRCGSDGSGDGDSGGRSGVTRWWWCVGESGVGDRVYTYYCQMKVNAATHKLATAGDGYCCWDGKKVIVNEAYIRCDLRLGDAEGTTCLPNATIFEELARIGKHKTRRKQRTATEVPYTEPQTKEHIPTPSHDPLPSGKDRMQLSELMEICTKLSDRVIFLKQIKTNQAAEIEKLKKRVKKLEGKKKKRTHGLKRLYKVGLTARVESSKEEECLDHGRMNNEDLFKVHDLDGDEVFVDVTTGENVKQDATIAENKVSTADQVVTIDKLTLAQTLMEIKAAKPKVKGVTIQKPNEFRTTSPLQPLHDKDKGKGIKIEPEKLLKKKYQISLDEEVTRKLKAQIKAEMEEEDMIAMEKDDANIAVIDE